MGDRPGHPPRWRQRILGLDVNESLAIAQVVPTPWGSSDEAVRQAKLIAFGLAERGHRVIVLAPATTAAEAAEGRRLVKAAGANGESLLPAPGEAPRVIAVGEALPLGGRRRAIPAGTAHAAEEVLAAIPFDVVHLHDPLPPSLPGAALRHSRGLNLGHFHDPEPRLPAGDVARKVGGALFGRIDMGVADFSTATDLIADLIPAGVTLLPRASESRPDQNPAKPESVVIAQLVGSDRGSLRNTLRALKQIEPAGWTARIGLPPGAPPPASLGPALRERVELVEIAREDEVGFFAGADVAIIGGGTGDPRPGDVIEALASGSVPVASTLPVHDELLADGELGPGFTPGDHLTLAAQLTDLLGTDRRVQFAARAESWRSQASADRLVTDVERICLQLVAKRHDTRANPRIAAKIAQRPLIDVDLHMHTDHSHDCATPVEVLLAQARARGLGAIAVTDHNEVSGALEARAKASGIKVIVGEEVKTKNQGEVIGLFIEQRIPPGMSFDETLDAIHAQGGIAYVPHPFDRMHSVPDYRHLLASIDRIDAIEVYNARVAIGEFNEEAARFAAKYRLPAGAGSDAHVAQGLGSVRIRMRDFDGPEEFLESLREADIVRSPSSLLFVQALKFLQTKATPPAARKATKRRKVKRVARNS